MTAGEGTGVLHQAGVQEFLWYSVPKRFPPDEWGDAVAVAATLLDELGLDRYAGIARSRSEEHTSELQSLMRISYAVFCLKKKKKNTKTKYDYTESKNTH